MPDGRVPDHLRGRRLFLDCHQVPTGEASNCTFGGADRRTMYVTSRALLKVVPMTVPGLPD